MKTVLYIMIALVMSANFTSCSTDPIEDEFLEQATVGEEGNGTVEDEDE